MHKWISSLPCQCIRRSFMNLLCLKLWQGMTFHCFFHCSHVFAVWGANERTKQLVDLMVRDSNYSIYPTFYSRCWFHEVSNIFHFHPYLRKISNLTSIFFRWVGSTTNQYCLDVEFGWTRNPLKRNENQLSGWMEFSARVAQTLPAARAAVGLVARHQKGWLVFSRFWSEPLGGSSQDL